MSLVGRKYFPLKDGKEVHMMRRVSLILTTLILASMLLAACGGQGTSTSAPGTNVPPATMKAPNTETPAATQAAGNGDLTTTPNVPVTGDDSPNRLTNLMGYDVWNQNGDQIGTVNDMVLDFDNAKVPYVVVGTGGFLGLGEKKVLVPWNMIQVQTAGNGTAGDKNALVYTGNQDLYKNFPDADLSSLLPAAGQPAANWDNTIKNYWQSGGTAGAKGLATNTPAGADMTAQPQATATAVAGSGNGQGQNIQKLQGVILASKLLDSTIEVNNSGTGANNGQSQGNSSNTPAATSASNGNGNAASPAATATSVDLRTGNSLGTEDMTVEDAIMDPQAGKVQYVVVTGSFTDGQRTVPVPVKYLQWDAASQKFILGVNTLALVNAPAIENGQYPVFSSKDWSSQWDKYWSNLKSDMLNKVP
jgi:sporulation protein YlmC with PRC-barrel domain